MYLVIHLCIQNIIFPGFAPGSAIQVSCNSAWSSADTAPPHLHLSFQFGFQICFQCGRFKGPVSQFDILEIEEDD